MKIKTIAIITVPLAIYLVVNALAAAVLNVAGYTRPFALTWTACGVLFVATTIVATVLFAWAAKVAGSRSRGSNG
jgi:hypothetical protein